MRSLKTLFDKNGIEIVPGNVLKVFHFIGARRKRHYMYKQAVGYIEIQNSKSRYLKISHLCPMDEPEEIGKTYYLERSDGRTLADYEIVQ